MDEKTKERFKWKFYSLAILLNLIILLAAVAVIGFFLGPKPYNTAIAGVLLIMVVVLSLYFAKRYRATKEWLDEQD
jgi:membrane protein YdbS with pleckstrin-like domain